MKIRNKLIVGFTAIILFSGVMGFRADSIYSGS